MQAEFEPLQASNNNVTGLTGSLKWLFGRTMRPYNTGIEGMNAARRAGGQRLIMLLPIPSVSLQWKRPSGGLPHSLTSPR